MGVRLLRSQLVGYILGLCRLSLRRCELLSLIDSRLIGLSLSHTHLHVLGFELVDLRSVSHTNLRTKPLLRLELTHTLLVRLTHAFILDISDEISLVAQSLGFFYMKLTELCGFDWMGGEEWKVMGLAPYGKTDEELLDWMRAMVRVKGTDGRVYVGQRSYKLRLR